MEQHREQYKQYDDTDIKTRNKLGRQLFFWSVVVFLTIVLPGIVSLLAPPRFHVGVFTLSAGAGVFALGRLLPRLTVWVPLAQGLVSLDGITGARVIYGGGLHPRFPWEAINEKSHQTLEQVTFQHEDTFDAQGTPMEVSWSWVGQPELILLDRFVYVDPTNIVTAFTDRMSQTLSALIARMTPADARRGSNFFSRVIANEFNVSPEAPADRDTDELKDRYLSGKWNDSASDDAEGKKSKLEKQFGFLFTYFNVADVDYPESVRKAMEASPEALGVLAAMATLAGIPAGDVNTDPAKVAKQLRRRKDYNNLLRAALAMTDQATLTNFDFGSGNPIGAAVGEYLKEERKS